MFLPAAPGPRTSPLLRLCSAQPPGAVPASFATVPASASAWAVALGPLVGRKVLRSSRSRASRVKAAESESAATVGDDAKFLAELQKRVQEVNAQLEVRRERIDRNWRRGRAKAQPAVIIQDDWVRRVALSGDEVFVGTASSGIRRHVLGAVEARQVFRVQGSPSRMVPADHQAQADPETSITSMAWNGRYLCAGLAGGRLQVWNEEAWLILDRSVDTRPCYVCVHDDVLVAAAGDSVMCWDVKNLEDLPLCKIQASCRVHCLAPAFEETKKMCRVKNGYIFGRFRDGSQKWLNIDVPRFSMGMLRFFADSLGDQHGPNG